MPLAPSTTHQAQRTDLAADVVLSVRGVSKKFCRNLRRSMLYGVRDLGFNLLGASQNTAHLRQDEFWALQDVSLELRRSEFLGIVGSNGSGKSTLLRIIAGIYPPDGGEIHMRGRVGALIALGAGFHPHMTGRENVYLNGAILGMDRAYIASRFDHIVQFADIGDFLDAPVATYSSGMRVRLGFAVAVHMAPDLLLVDEVLSVGDSSFRERCFNHMMAYKKNGGTVIFISHNTVAVEQVCDRVVWLEHGHLVDSGKPFDVILAYEKRMQELSRMAESRQLEPAVASDQRLVVTHAEVCGADGQPSATIAYGEAFDIRLAFQCRQPVQQAYFGLALFQGAVAVATTSMLWDGPGTGPLQAEGVVSCRINQPNLAPGNYVLQVFVHAHATGKIGSKHLMPPTNVSTFAITPGPLPARMPGAAASHFVSGMPPVVLDHVWTHGPAAGTPRPIAKT